MNLKKHFGVLIALFLLCTSCFITAGATEELSPDVKAEVDHILEGIDKSWSALEKALAVNDYFALNYHYDETLSIFSKEDLFTCKTGVCSAYANAYKYIMELLGIPCDLAASKAMNHAWNMVEIDGEWYHVDVTWNDPVPDTEGRTRHACFLISDDEISDPEHKHYGWESSHASSSHKYDHNFWEQVDSQIVIHDGHFIYVDKTTGAVCKRNEITNEVTTLYQIDSKWYCWDKPNAYWQGFFSSVGMHGETLYLNTATSILAMDVNGGNVRTFHEHDASTGYIWGLTVLDGKLTYYVSRDRSAYGVESSKVLELPVTKKDDSSAGAVNSYAEKVMREIVGASSVHDSAADADGNGRVSLRDILLLLTSALGN